MRLQKQRDRMNDGGESQSQRPQEGWVKAPDAVKKALTGGMNRNPETKSVFVMNKLFGQV